MHSRALQDAVCALERAMRAMECHLTTANHAADVENFKPDDKPEHKPEHNPESPRRSELRLPVSDSPQDLAMSWCDICLGPRPEHMRAAEWCEVCMGARGWDEDGDEAEQDVQDEAGQPQESDGVMYGAGRGPHA